MEQVEDIQLHVLQPNFREGRNIGKVGNRVALVIASGANQIALHLAGGRAERSDAPRGLALGDAEHRCRAAAIGNVLRSRSDAERVLQHLRRDMWDGARARA